MTYQPRPIPGDAATEIVAQIFEADEEWLLSIADGTYDSFAAEIMKRDGSDLQRVVAIIWRGRYNKTSEKGEARIMMSPEDAIGLADNLVHTALWMLEVEKRRDQS